LTPEKDQDVGRASTALGALPIAYHSFHAGPSGPKGALPDSLPSFPLLAAVLPGVTISHTPIADIAPALSPPPQTPDLSPPPSPIIDSHNLPAVAPSPPLSDPPAITVSRSSWQVSAAKPPSLAPLQTDVTPLNAIFRILRDGMPQTERPSDQGRRLQDLLGQL
jgi:hypothetical protein